MSLYKYKTESLLSLVNLESRSSYNSLMEIETLIHKDRTIHTLESLLDEYSIQNKFLNKQINSLLQENKLLKLRREIEGQKVKKYNHKTGYQKYDTTKFKKLQNFEKEGNSTAKFINSKKNQKDNQKKQLQSTSKKYLDNIGNIQSQAKPTQKHYSQDSQANKKIEIINSSERFQSFGQSPQQKMKEQKILQQIQIKSPFNQTRLIQKIFTQKSLSKQKKKQIEKSNNKNSSQQKSKEKSRQKSSEKKYLTLSIRQKSSDSNKKNKTQVELISKDKKLIEQIKQKNIMIQNSKKNEIKQQIKSPHQQNFILNNTSQNLNVINQPNQILNNKILPSIPAHVNNQDKKNIQTQSNNIHKKYVSVVSLNKTQYTNNNSFPIFNPVSNYQSLPQENIKYISNIPIDINIRKQLKNQNPQQYSYNSFTPKKTVETVNFMSNKVYTDLVTSPQNKIEVQKKKNKLSLTTRTPSLKKTVTEKNFITQNDVRKNSMNMGVMVKQKQIINNNDREQLSASNRKSRFINLVTSKQQSQKKRKQN